MTVPVALETCALIAKYLNSYAPMLGAIGSEGNRALKREMISAIAKALLEDTTALLDIQKIIMNLLGENREFVLGDLANDLYEAWQINRMDRLIGLCQELGIYTRKDLANLAWVIVNWNSDNAGSD